MSKTRIYSFGALNLKVSPFLHKDGELLRAVNVERDMIGAWKKRPGYIKYLGTPDNAQITTLFSWRQNDESTLYTYRKSGGTLYYSTGGTGAWTIAGNGTLTANSHVGYTVLDNVLILGDGTATTRHSVGTTAGAGGTAFTATSGAPLAEHFTTYQGRVFAARGTSVTGTNTDLFYSTTGTATDWTTDSSSIRIGGAGRINAIYKSNDRVVVTKDSGNMFKWDGFNLVDLATDSGLTSPYSVGNVEDYRLYLNRKGVYGFGGNRPEIVSNVIEKQIYNDRGSGVAGTVFDNAPGVVHRYDYLCSVGTVTDDITNETISDCIIKYDYQMNEFVNWKFAHRPYSFHSYKNLSGVDTLIFGNNGGQAYQFGGTALSDDGVAIESVLMGVIHLGAPESDKKWNYLWAFTNPGCQAKIQVAMADTLTKENLNWVDLKQVKDGVVEVRFPSGSQSKLLFWKLYENSSSERWNLYGFSVDANIINRK